MAERGHASQNLLLGNLQVQDSLLVRQGIADGGEDRGKCDFGLKNATGRHDGELEPCVAVGHACSLVWPPRSKMRVESGATADGARTDGVASEPLGQRQFAGHGKFDHMIERMVNEVGEIEQGRQKLINKILEHLDRSSSELPFGLHQSGAAGRFIRRFSLE